MFPGKLCLGFFSFERERFRKRERDKDREERKRGKETVSNRESYRVSKSTDGAG